MGKGGCVDGQLTTTLYSSPVPLIGVYIAAGTLVCLFCMTFDIVYGLTRRKPFLPCKLFPMNAFTMTVLAVATKIPLDLTSPMPRASDQLSKLTATALMCTSIGFYMPSLGTMRASERYGNLAALSIMGITMVINVCIQLHTGVIFEFIVEHIIIVVCISVLLVLMWSSALAFSSQKYSFDCKRLVVGEGQEGLKSTLDEIYRINYQSNPQTLLCTTTHHHAFAILCAVSSILVLEAIPRSFIAPKEMKSHCSGASDYKWSIRIVIVIQFLTIAVGTFSIIYRWFSFMWHYGVDALIDNVPDCPERDLLDLVGEPVLELANNNLSVVLTVTVGIFLIAFIYIQKMLFAFTSYFLGFPLYVVGKFLSVTINNWDTPLDPFGGFLGSIESIAWEDMDRWKNELKSVHPAQDLIKLISKWRAGSPSTVAFASAFEIDCCHFVNKFEATSRDYLKSLGGELEVDFEYRFSCMTLLVLSGIIEYLMPSSSSKESLMKSFKELFEIIHFVDHNCISKFTVFDRAKLVAAKRLWVGWSFHIELVKFMMPSAPKESESQSILEKACSDYQEYIRDPTAKFYNSAVTSDIKQMHLMGVEISFLCNFILGSENFGPDKDLWHFVEECFVRMVCYMLVMLLSAIVKEITADYVTEIDETRLKRAWKFFFQLESLKDTIKWYWPKNLSQANDAHSNFSQHVAALLQGLEGQANVSEVINEKVEEEKEDDVGDTIKEIQGSDGFV